MNYSFETHSKTLGTRRTVIIFLSIVFSGLITEIGTTTERVRADSLAIQINPGTDQLSGPMVITHDGRFSYVEFHDTIGGTDISRIKKFDMATGQLIVSIPAFNAGHLMLTTDGTQLLALTASSGEVNHPIDQITKISVATDQVDSTISTNSWPKENGSQISLAGMMLMPDAVHALVSYRSGASAFMRKVNISDGTASSVTLPAEFSAVSCDICKLSSDGNFLYVPSQLNGWKNLLSRVDLNLSVTKWTVQLPYNALARNYVEAADGFLYVLGSDANGSYQNSYVFRLNPTTGVRDSQATIETLGGQTWNDNFALVDDGWGIRIFTEQYFNGEFGFQWRIISNHLHLTNLQFSNKPLLIADGVGGGFAINANTVAFWTYVDASRTHAIYVARLEDDDQFVTNPTIPNQILGIGFPALSSTASSGGIVTYTSVNTDVCTTDGAIVTGVNVGICNIRIAQAGGRGWKSTSTIVSFSFRKPTISFESIQNSTQRASSTTVSARSDSGLPVVFSSRTPQVCTVSRSIVTHVTSGRCSIVASQTASGPIPAAVDVERQFTIYKSSVNSEIGVSINAGATYTNNPAVILNLAWPEFATGVKISNDGGFSASTTSNFEVDDQINWTLDSSFKGPATKIVYLKFTGAGIDSSRNYSDDIILDTTAPTLSNAVATVDNSTKSGVTVASFRTAAAGTTVKLTVNAKDTLSGIGLVQIKTAEKGTITTLSTPNPKAASRVVRIRTTKSTLYIRVVDRAGNYSRWVTSKLRK